MIKKAQRKYSSSKLSNDHDSLQKIILKPLSKYETNKFNKFDIVWAKITGYPWWPAIVTTVPGQKDKFRKDQDGKNRRPLQKFNSNNRAEYRVDFIADQTHAFLKKKFLLQYRQNRDKLHDEGLQFSRRKRRFFQMAISEADQLDQVLQLSKLETSNQGLHINNKQIKKQKIVSSSSQSQEGQSQSQQNDQSKNKSQKSQKNKIVQSENSQNQSSQSEQKQKLKKQKPLLKQTAKTKKICIQNRNKISNEIDKKQRSKQQLSIIPHLIKRKKGRPAKNKVNQQNFIKQKNRNVEQKIKKQKIGNLQIRQTLQNHEQQQSQKQIFYQDQKQSVKLIIQDQQNNIQTIPHDDNQSQAIKYKSINNQKELQASQQSISALMNDLLQKYKLHRIDQVQIQYKKQIQMSAVFDNSNNSKFKGSKSIAFIKNVLSNYGKRKINKKYQDYQNSQQKMFTQTIFSLNKLKDSQVQKIQLYKKNFLIQYCKKWIARKINNIISSILKNNHIQITQDKILQSIKQRSKNIAELIFYNEDLESYTFDKKTQQVNKRKNSSHSLDFIKSFKSKVQQSVKFLRLCCLQNWELLAKIGNFSPQICILVKSFEQYLQKQCGLILRNQQKFEDIIKQIGIQNQKTQFTCGYITVQMQVQNDSPHNLANKYLNKKHSESNNIHSNTKKSVIHTK